MSNQLNFETLSSQYKLVNSEIEQKENDIRSISVNQFVLNPQIMEIAKEIKELHTRREIILNELQKLEDLNND